MVTRSNQVSRPSGSAALASGVQQASRVRSLDRGSQLTVPRGNVPFLTFVPLPIQLRFLKSLHAGLERKTSPLPVTLSSAHAMANTRAIAADHLRMPMPS